MKRSLVALLAAPALLVAAVTTAGEAGKVSLSWHGQSFFLIKSSKGTTLAIDPHDIPEYGRIIGGLKADAVLFSHLHNDHTQKEVLVNHKDKNFKVIPGLTGQGRFAKWANLDEKFKDFHIRSVGTYHDNMAGMKHGLNSVLILEVDGWRIVHLGDLGHKLSEEQVRKIGKVDVLMIPVGGVYTLNGMEAQEVVKQLKPKEYILPMHYGNIRYEDLLTVDEFLDSPPAAAVALSKNGGLIYDKEGKDHARFVRSGILTSDNRLTLDRDPKRPRPTVVVLHWWPQPGKKKAEK
ncbi:MAG: MBL fold metallo-hydrolase [Gemmataceae bacterium]|nr:MBL fold metallo-hydrolase [Gemmataceae bacterium]